MDPRGLIGACHEPAVSPASNRTPVPSVRGPPSPCFHYRFGLGSGSPAQDFRVLTWKTLEITFALSAYGSHVPLHVRYVGKCSFCKGLLFPDISKWYIKCQGSSWRPE